MVMRKPKTIPQMHKVWQRLMDYASGDNDFFGTEGQCDPRGDQRN